MVVRNGRVLARSQEQQHYFNTPFQLTLVPPSYRGRVLSDRCVISACLENIHTFRVLVLRLLQTQTKITLETTVVINNN